jgi:HAD superfamily hydrolase (TIGR01509 family)
VLRALIWDVDGTVAETEAHGHRVAFNQAFAEAGLDWHWDVEAYGRLLQVSGGRERLLAFMHAHPGAPRSLAEREVLARRLHLRKNAFYAEQVAQRRLEARPGVRRLMGECVQAGVALAVATTTSTRNVGALFASLFGEGWRAGFAAVVCAEDAPLKKPDPQAYRCALQRLGIGAHEAFALEDSPNGLQAARAAGIACGITRSAYFRDADFDGAAWVRDDLEHPMPLALPALQQGFAPQA